MRLTCEEGVRQEARDGGVGAPAGVVCACMRACSARTHGGCLCCMQLRALQHVMLTQRHEARPHASLAVTTHNVPGRRQRHVEVGVPRDGAIRPPCQQLLVRVAWCGAACQRGRSNAGRRHALDAHAGCACRTCTHTHVHRGACGLRAEWWQCRESLCGAPVTGGGSGPSSGSAMMGSQAAASPAAATPLRAGGGVAAGNAAVSALPPAPLMPLDAATPFGSAADAGALSGGADAAASRKRATAGRASALQSAAISASATSDLMAPLVISTWSISPLSLKIAGFGPLLERRGAAVRRAVCRLPCSTRGLNGHLQHSNRHHPCCRCGEQNTCSRRHRSGLPTRDPRACQTPRAPLAAWRPMGTGPRHPVTASGA